MKGHIDKLQSILSSDQVVTGASLCKPYGQDWTFLDGEASAVLFPKSTQEVAKILTYCCQNHLKVVPSGGRTGLAGGAVARKGELVLSLEKMNQILELDPVSRTITAEAGCILHDLEESAKSHGLMYPIHLASAGSCQLGGNIATNAGGVRFVAYGGTRQHVLGLTVVLASGQVLDLDSKLRKDNTGFDLKQLFIGTEGTLGVITAATINLVSANRETILCFAGFQDIDQLKKIMTRSFTCGIHITGFEFLSDSCLEKVCSDHSLKEPFDKNCKYYLLLECEGVLDNDSPIAKLLEELMEQNVISDAIIAQNPKDYQTLWSYRELISESLQSSGTVYKHDISLPLCLLPEFIKQIEIFQNDLDDGVSLYLFGHVGDGNLHINYLGSRGEELSALQNRVTPFKNKVFKLLKQLQGSISAEHGIGLLKIDDLLEFQTDSERELLTSLKNTIDPSGILNPGKILKDSRP